MDEEDNAELIEDQQAYDEEQKVKAANDRLRAKVLKAKQLKRKKVNKTKEDRDAEAQKLDELLGKCELFSEKITKKTAALGRIGSGMDDKPLTNDAVELQSQPQILTGGKLREYQLAGMTWMFEIVSQGLSGILADEMGLGKTIQTISLIAQLREEAKFYGPHLIVVPLSTMSNWLDEFSLWAPTINVVKYHGTPAVRQAALRREKKYYTTVATGKGKRSAQVTADFPVFITTPEMVMKDAKFLRDILWEVIVIVSLISYV
jgi:ATP-dependent DNA helicase